MNHVVLIGRLCADPELKTTQSGVHVCSFRVAVDRRFTGADGQRQADFIPCTAWRQAAEFVAKYFQKGKLIGVMGSLQSRSYEDSTGNRRTAYEVMCEQVEFVGAKEGNEQGANRPPEGFVEISSDDDLPF